MKYIFAILLFTMTTTAYGGSNITIAEGLSDAQRAEIVLQAANLAAANKAVPETIVPKVNEVREWTALIDAVGDGIVDVAKKTGMAVNDFSESRVGMFTMFIIAWNYLGQDLLGVIFGFSWLTFMVPAWIYCYRRLFLFEQVVYYDKSSSGGKRKEVSYSDGKRIGDATTFFYWLTLVLICLVGLVAL